MRFAALAADYDGTLASQGHVGPEIIRGLQRFSTSGRKLLLVTGRELDELIAIFPQIGIFDRVVAENGALLYCPRTGARKPLGIAPAPEFIAELARRGVDPLSVGCSIVATVTPNETLVLDTIRDMGLELQVVFNKGAVMILPAGVNKASGLAAALDEMKLSARNVAAIGDAENDHALLRSAEFGVAVANALPTLKRDADRTSSYSHGAAVCELMEAILADDLRAWSQPQNRRSVALGCRADGTPVSIRPDRCDVLLAGPSGSGKSVHAAGILERIAERGYQYCVVDPQGDYADLPGAVVLGSSEREPALEEISIALENPRTNVAINLSAVPEAERLGAFKRLLPRLTGLRATCGRPHWVLIGEAQSLFPAGDSDAVLKPLDAGSCMLYVSVHPDAMSAAVLNSIDLVLGMGTSPEKTLKSYCDALRVACPVMPADSPRSADALAWARRGEHAPYRFIMQPSEAERRQHRRRLTHDQLPAERSFYFRGAHEKLNLRAQNLPLFLQIGMGVDDETWLHHLGRGDYSRWLLEAAKDPRLAAEIAAIERAGLDAESSRGRVTAIMENFMGARQGRSDPAVRS